MIEHVDAQVIMWQAIAGGVGTILPIVLLILWKWKKKCSILPALVGALIFIVFAMVLEGIPKVLFFSGLNPVSNYVLSHSWAYVLIGCLLAGIFEEVGRFVAFRFFLKKYQSKETAITYGIGHGGIESILLLGISSLSTIALMMAVNSGTISQTLSTLTQTQADTFIAQLTTLAGYNGSQAFLAIFERIVAITFHVSMSVVVFKAVSEKKIGYLFLAIVIHSVFDVPAALYQCGLIGLVFTEVLLFVLVGAAAVVAWKLYHNFEDR